MSHSRFLQIAYSSTKEPRPVLPLSPTTSVPHLTFPDETDRPNLPPAPPYLLPFAVMCPCETSIYKSDVAHLKRRKSHGSKPPHYHASLLRSPLSHRKGLFRPSNKAADFFRWDALLGANVSLSALCQARGRTKSSGGVGMRLGMMIVVKEAGTKSKYVFKGPRWSRECQSIYRSGQLTQGTAGASRRFPRS